MGASDGDGGGDMHSGYGSSGYGAAAAGAPRGSRGGGDAGVGDRPATRSGGQQVVGGPYGSGYHPSPQLGISRQRNNSNSNSRREY